MYRIIHISDLHIGIKGAENKSITTIQWLSKILGKKLFDQEISAKEYNEDKLEALKIILRSMKPDLITITGDITNFGDKDSFNLAVKIIEEIKSTSESKHVLCVPGNHDSLVERTALLLDKEWAKFFIALVSKIFKEVDIIKSLSLDLIKKEILKEKYQLLKNYNKVIGEKGWIFDVSKPFIDSAGWGKIVIFPFDSTNDFGLMANEGCIGSHQFNRLNQFIQNRENEEVLLNAVRIALLHHHPINAPGNNVNAIERAYNSMKDGSIFVHYMNECNFHFILHGHEHKPYFCNLNYKYGEGEREKRGTCIMAAGSALQGDHNQESSFNVIDLWTPFRARLRRFKYQSTGFDKKAEFDRWIPIRPLSEINFSDIRNSYEKKNYTLRNFSKMEIEAFDEIHKYKLLKYCVKIEKTQLYTGKYSRVGEVIGPEDSEGLIFIITGSPAMEYDEMDISAIDNINKTDLSCEPSKDDPEKKIIKVFHKNKLSPGDKFNISLNFRWNVTESEPNDYDGVNLLYFHHPVERLQYKAILPSQPNQVKVKAIGINEQDIKTENEKNKKTENGMYLYSFEICNPPPMVYIIFF